MLEAIPGNGASPRSVGDFNQFSQPAKSLEYGAIARCGCWASQQKSKIQMNMTFDGQLGRDLPDNRVMNTLLSYWIDRADSHLESGKLDIRARSYTRQGQQQCDALRDFFILSY